MPLGSGWGQNVGLKDLPDFDFIANGGICVSQRYLFLYWQDKYIQQLVNAMEDVFYVKYKVQPQLVADTHQYMYKSAGKLVKHSFCYRGLKGSTE